MSSVDVQRLLRFARDLQQATDVDTLVRIYQREVLEVTGYRHAWLAVFEEGMKRCRVLSVTSELERLVWEHSAVVPVEGDGMMEELCQSRQPVVVLEAAEDPRTNKQIVSRLGNRTIINVPMLLVDNPLGTMGTGTFGDEGPRAPTPEQLEYLVGMAGQMAVAVARIRWLEERERLERERSAVSRRVAAAQRMESVSVLAGGIGHDLNNILLLVLLNAGQVGRGPLSEQQRTDLAAVVSAAQRAAALARRLLEMSRPQPVRIEVVELHKRLRDLLTMLRSALPSEVSLELVEAPEAQWCVGDGGQLEQVFLNLCMNARDAMPEGGRLRIETSETEVNEAFVRAHPWARPGRYALVTVSDTGHGMSPEVLERVLEPFYTTKEPGRGTGLGLTVAHGIVRQHNGMLHIYSEPGMGTTVKVYLPSYEQGAVAKLESALKGPEPVGDERILVADDDAEVRAAVVRILEGAGYRVSTASNGAEAVAAAGREHFDLVLLDVVMPQRSGKHAFEHLRDMRPGLPCLFSTGYAPALLPEGLVEGLGVDVLQKPYDPEVLLRAVRRTLDLRRP